MSDLLATVVSAHQGLLPKFERFTLLIYGLGTAGEDCDPWHNGLPGGFIPRVSRSEFEKLRGGGFIRVTDVRKGGEEYDFEITALGFERARRA